MKRFAAASRGLASLFVVVGLLTAAPRLAHAQVHYDVGVEGGVTKRFLTSQPDGGSDPGFGPSFGVQGHLALLPMLRVGAYFAFDYSPHEFEPARLLYAGGLHARILPPIFRNACTYTWVGLGFGYVTTYAPSFNTQDTVNGTTQNTLFYGSTGHFFEIPLSIGVARRIRKPFQVFAELGFRLGFASSGEYYDGRPGQTSNFPPVAAVSPGSETIAVSLSVGIQLDQ